MPEDSANRDPLSRLSDTPLGAMLQDPEERRYRVYQAWADHPDPLLREIGTQLRDGTMRPRDLGRVEAYRDILRRGIDGIARFDVEDVISQASPGCDRQRRHEPSDGREPRP